VGVTRDTSEADLKQRRELRAGSLLYSDAPPLRAATNGRALILEGIEKAERNVLPLLNNLLENREMSLEDGTFLAGPSQSESDGESHESAGADSGRGARVRHAKRGFVVIGIGLPQPTYAGNPLDPPLRSRFATRRVRNATGSDAVYSLSARVPAMPAERLRQLCSTVDALRLRSVLAHAGVNAGDGRRLPYFPEGGSEAVAKLLTALPQLSSLEALERRLPLSVLRISGRSVDGIRNEISSLLASSALPMRYALAEISCSMEGLASPTEALASTADRGRGSSGGQQRSRACMSPYVCVCRFVPVDSDGVARGTGHVHLAAPCGLQPIWSPASVKTGSVTGADGTPYSQGGPSPSDIGAMSVNQLKALLASRDVSYEDVLEKSELRRLALGIFSADEEERTLDWRRWQGDGPSLVNSQLHALHSMCQEHAINNDTCVVAPRGVGKTTLVRRFAGLFGYDQPHTVFCHNEMPAHELLQRRATDPNGDTIWRDSPLLTAAKTGGLAVLDGIHRLPRGVLSGCLAPLFTDRMIPTLPDGSRLVPPGQWDHLLSTTMLSPMELNIRGIWCVHPSFRILATAEPATEIAGAKGWLDDELLPLFAWVTLAAPSESELRQMLRLSSCPPPALPILKVLLQYRIALEAAAAAEPSLRGAIPSQRQLLRVAAFVRRRPEDAAGALRRCTSAGMLTIPPASRETSHALLAQSARELGLPPSVVPSLVGLEDGGDNESAAPGWDQTPSKDSAVAARRSQAAHEMKELEGLAIQRRMMGNFAGIGAAIDRKLDEGVRKMQEERRATENAKTRRVCERAAAMATRTKEGTKDGDGRNGDNDHIRMTDKELSIGDVTVARRTPAEPSLVPRPAFVPIAGHVALLREMLLEWEAGSHLLLLGDQGVGKNKLTDKLLQLLDGEREYVQLHRDTTVGSLTLAPSLDGGIVSWRDSPLVRAARLGRVLVVDEADKAPLEVVCVLKALAEDGDLSLGDGRRLVSGCLVASRRAAVAGFQSEVREIDGNEQERLTQSAQLGDDVIEVSPAFRMIVLANPPGWPFQGNDFYRECGDVFSTLAVPNPGAASQAQLLRRVAPSLHQQDLATLLSLFARLRLLHAQGVLSYPYSVRELVLVSRRLDAFPSDGLSGALGDIFDADAEDRRTAEILANVLAEHGVQSLALELRRGKRKGDLSLQLEERSQDFGSQAEKKPPPMPDGGPKHGEWDGKPHVGGNKYAGGTGGTGTAGLGGRAGPYRLDVGQKVHMLSEEEKKEGLSQETIESAKRMADEAYAERLKEIGMSAHDAELYDAYATSVASQVARMRRVLQDHRERSKERIWLKGRPHGELDEVIFDAPHLARTFEQNTTIAAKGDVFRLIDSPSRTHRARATHIKTFLDSI